MKTINQQSHLRTDNNLLVITHLAQLLTCVTGFGGLLVPFVIWLTQKDTVKGMDAHGKLIINFQLSIILLYVLCFPAILIFGLGILGFIVVGITACILPIINAIKVSNGEAPSSFMTIQFLK